MAISEQWAELLEPGLRAIFETQREALAAESKIPALFNVATSNKAEEHDLGAGGFSDFNEYEGAIEYDDTEQLYKTTYSHVEYAKGFKVERKLVDDDQYNIINRRPQMLATAAMRTREKNAASIFNNAFSASFTGGDAVSLCNASHPLSPSSGSTHGNAGSTALSNASVESTRQAMRAFVDDRGELTPVRPDTLLVPPELEETAWDIVNPGINDNDNFQRGQFRVVVWDYLTDANNWFMVDSSMAKMFLNWFQRVSLELAMDPTSNFSLESRWRAYERYSYGWSDWRWVYGHEVA